MSLEIARVQSREVVRSVPNFRDHGRMVDQPLIDLLTRLQQRYGQAYASEGGLRTMIARDTGHMPGVTTIAKALRRLAAQGLVVHVWLRAGQIKPDGKPCTHGTRLVFVPKTRRQRRAARAFNARQDRRAGYETRRTVHAARELVAKIGAPPPAAPARDPFAAERARQLAAARERPDLWVDEREKPPPE
jgi:hypothetical protein